MRAVLDTNVLVSALLGGTASAVLDHLQADAFELVVTTEIAREYLEVLRRPKFQLPQDVVEAIGVYLLRKAVFVTPLERLEVITANSTDNRFLEAAIAGDAEVIVSGDKHLLDLGRFREVHIITLREFLDRLEK
jgi:putative PIN family toxin of toxin-antitoxin system